MPGPPLVLHPDAVEERPKPLGSGISKEVDHGIEAISEEPERWPLFVHGTRRYLFRRLPFQIV